MENNEGKIILNHLEKFHQEVYLQSKAELDKYPEKIELLVQSLKVLNNIAICGGGCRGGDHVFEYLAGRAFNLSFAAYKLILYGLYDEALNEIRSLAELANLLSLFWSDHDKVAEWKTGTRRQRIDNFSPQKVRDAITANGAVMIADYSTYRELCEISTHVTPQTTPNKHTDDNKPRVGGFYQPNGIKMAIDYLDRFSFSVAIGFCKFLGYEKEFEILAGIVAKQNEKSA